MRTRPRLSNPPPARPSIQPHQLTPEAERIALAFLTGSKLERTMHVSALNCALMSASDKVRERLQWLYEGTHGMADPVEAIDSLMALLATERVRALDCVAVRAKLAAEGKPLPTQPFKAPAVGNYDFS